MLHVRTVLSIVSSLPSGCAATFCRDLEITSLKGKKSQLKVTSMANLDFLKDKFGSHLQSVPSPGV